MSLNRPWSAVLTIRRNDPTLLNMFLKARCTQLGTTLS